jgi:hypothetical protein
LEYSRIDYEKEQKLKIILKNYDVLGPEAVIKAVKNVLGLVFK